MRGLLGRVNGLIMTRGRQAGRQCSRKRLFGIFGVLNLRSGRMELRSTLLTRLLEPGNVDKIKGTFRGTFLTVLKLPRGCVISNEMSMRLSVKAAASSREKHVSVVVRSNGRTVVVRGGVCTRSRPTRLLGCAGFTGGGCPCNCELLCLALSKGRTDSSSTRKYPCRYVSCGGRVSG